MILTGCGFFFNFIRLLWDHMKKMAAVLLQTADAMNSFLSGSYFIVKELTISPTWRYLHQCPERRYPDAPPPVILKGENDYKEHFVAGKQFNNLLKEQESV